MKRKRLDLGLLQRAVAQKLGVAEASVYNWENGRSSPALRFVPRILAFLGYDPYDTQPENLGERIVAARRRLGLTQRELARRLDVDASTLGRWERGEGQPSRKLVGRLSALLPSLGTTSDE